METRSQEKVSAREQLKDISMDVTWAKIAQKYLGNSSSWIYNKISEIDGNGSKGGFTEEEKKQFKAALYDLAECIRRTADNFD